MGCYGALVPFFRYAAAHLDRKSVHVCPQRNDWLAFPNAAYYACLGNREVDIHPQTIQRIPVFRNFA